MPRTASNWTIDGMHPAEYAAQWGSGNSGEGALFYNASDQCRRTGEVIGNPYWDADEWRTFARVVRAQGAGVAKAIRTAKGRKATGWSAADVRNLQRLAEWAEYMAGRASSSLPWLSSTM